MKTKIKLLLLTFAMLFVIVTASVAAPPDLTDGGVPNEDPPVTINLGPTGARGWTYRESYDTSKGLQILITTAEDGRQARHYAQRVTQGGQIAGPRCCQSDAGKNAFHIPHTAQFVTK